MKAPAKSKKKPGVVKTEDGWIVASKTTPVQKIELELLRDGSYALYLNGNIQFVSGHDDDIYHGTLATKPAKRLGKTPIRALILGGGDGLVARNLLALPNTESVLQVEIDKDMMEFCANHPTLRWLNKDSFRNPKMRTVAADARKFVESKPSGKKFNLAIVDFPDPEPEIVDLFQEAFYRQLIKHLDPMRYIVAVQASTAFSPTEQIVTRGLSGAMGRRVVPDRFAGRYMDDGVIVVGDSGRPS